MALTLKRDHWWPVFRDFLGLPHRDMVDEMSDAVFVENCDMAVNTFHADPPKLPDREAERLQQCLMASVRENTAGAGRQVKPPPSKPPPSKPPASKPVPSKPPSAPSEQPPTPSEPRSVASQPRGGRGPRQPPRPEIRELAPPPPEPPRPEVLPGRTDVPAQSTQPANPSQGSSRAPTIPGSKPRARAVKPAETTTPAVPPPPAQAPPTEPSQPTPAISRARSPRTDPARPGQSPAAKPTQPAAQPAQPAAIPAQPPGKPTQSPAQPTQPPAKPTQLPANPGQPTAKPSQPPPKSSQPPPKPSQPTANPTAKPTPPPAKPAQPPAKPTQPPEKPPGKEPSPSPSDEAEHRPKPALSPCWPPLATDHDVHTERLKMLEDFVPPPIVEFEGEAPIDWNYRAPPAPVQQMEEIPEAVVPRQQERISPFAPPLKIPGRNPAPPPPAPVPAPPKPKPPIAPSTTVKILVHLPSNKRITKQFHISQKGSDVFAWVSREGGMAQKEYELAVGVTKLNKDATLESQQITRDILMRVF